jgi:hypothetical protein
MTNRFGLVFAPKDSEEVELLSVYGKGPYRGCESKGIKQSLQALGLISRVNL